MNWIGGSLTGHQNKEKPKSTQLGMKSLKIQEILKKNLDHRYLPWEPMF